MIVAIAHYLLPEGCRTLAEAAERLLANLPPAEVDTLQQQLYDLLAQQLQSSP